MLFRSDGVFRYEPPAYEPPHRREDDDEDIANWFDTSTDPKVAEAVRAAEAVARQEVPSPLASTPAIGRGPEPTQGVAPPSALPASFDQPNPFQPPSPGVDLPRRPTNRPNESTELSDDPRFQ